MTNTGLQRGQVSPFVSGGQINLRGLIEGEVFSAQELNPAFVYMQYLGYLRRVPDEAGFQFWLQKLNTTVGTSARPRW